MCTNQKRLLIIVPAYNEADSIKKVVLGLLNIKLSIIHDILVINDGSTDNTIQEVKKINVPYIDLPVNIGIGATVQTGFIYALRNNYDYAIQIDGDGQHPPENIQTLLDAILNSGVDLIIGSRFLSDKGFKSSFLRRVGINYLKLLIKVFCGINITDATSGLRVYNKKSLEIAAKIYPDEYPEPESIIIYHLMDLRISEVPVIMKERYSGSSSISSLKSVYYIIKVSFSILYTFLKFKLKKNECN